MLFLHEFLYDFLQVVSFDDIRITGLFCCQDISAYEKVGDDVWVGHTTVLCLNVVNLSTMLDVVVEACNHLRLVAHVPTLSLVPSKADIIRASGRIARSWLLHHQVHLVDFAQGATEKSLPHVTESLRDICNEILTSTSG